MKLKVILLMLSTILFYTSNTFGVNLKYLEKIDFASEVELLSTPYSFCVTDDELYMIPDPEAGNIKIYGRKGTSLELVKIIGKKGFGSGELVKPTYCFYSKEENKFGVFDYVKRYIYIYDRIGGLNFELVKAIYCRALGYDARLRVNKLLISGYLDDQNGNPYDFYYVDIGESIKGDSGKSYKTLTNYEPTFLLPSYVKYGLNSFSQYNTEYSKKPNIKAIGVKGWFDMHGDDVYFAWEGDRRIIKLNINSKKWTSLRKEISQESNYKKPSASAEYVKAWRLRDFKTVREEQLSKMSLVRNIFASSHYVLVIYQGPILPGRESFWCQFFTLAGDFIKEVPILNPPGLEMWFEFDKDKNILHSLSLGKDKEKDKKRYFILKHEITR
jgi:hypothetical protein